MHEGFQASVSLILVHYHRTSIRKDRNREVPPRRIQCCTKGIHNPLNVLHRWEILPSVANPRPLMCPLMQGLCSSVITPPNAQSVAPQVKTIDQFDHPRYSMNPGSTFNYHQTRAPRVSRTISHEKSSSTRRLRAETVPERYFRPEDKQSVTHRALPAKTKASVTLLHRNPRQKILLLEIAYCSRDPSDKSFTGCLDHRPIATIAYITAPPKIVLPLTHFV